MKITAIAVLVLATTAAGLPAAETRTWDFQSGLDGWRPWGTGAGMTAEQAGRVAGLSSDAPRSGKQCLVVRDELDTHAPYAVVRVAVSPERRYLFRGWTRADEQLPAGPFIQIAAVAHSQDGDRHLAWLDAPSVEVGPSWHPFEVGVPALPQNATHVLLAVRPTRYNHPAARATVYVDDLEFADLGEKPGAATGQDLRGESWMGRGRADWSPFRMGHRPAAEPLVDLSGLLHRPAGKHGFLHAKGGHFVFEDGTRPRFVADNIHANRGLFPSHEQAERVADTLARYGVNLVRFHLMEGVLIDRDRSGRRLISGDDLDRFDYFVKTLKDRGIYILLDSVTGQSTLGFREDDGVKGWDAYHPHRPWAFFDPRLRELAKDYMRQLLTRVNRYTGNTLLDEPAVAMLLLINEQTLFFDWHTDKGQPEHYASLLRRLYNEWLARNGGATRDELARLWSNDAGETALLPEEDPAAGNVELPGLRALQGGGSAWAGVESPVRLRTAYRFLKELQGEYHREMKAYLISLGCKVPIGGSNIIYNVPELDAQRDMDFTSQNVYYDHVRRTQSSAGVQLLGMHNRPAVEINPLIAQNRAMIEPAIAGAKLNTHPITSTESAMMWPHEWRASYFLSLFATAALQDWDAVFHYNHMGGFGYSWDRADQAGVILNTTVHFNDPALTGTMPAVALMHLRGDVSPARLLVQVVYDEDDLLDGRWDVRSGGFPFNYLTFVSRVEGAVGRADTRAQWQIARGVGTDGMAYDGPDDPRTPHRLAAELDEQLKTRGLLPADRGLVGDRLVSDTGQVVRDWGGALLTVDTPRTQAMTGFPGAPLAFSGATIDCDSDFATIIINALDDRPIGETGRLLITAVGRAVNCDDRYTFRETVIGAAGVRRGEQMAVERGAAGETLIERIRAEIRVRMPDSHTRATWTPLHADFSAQGDLIDAAVEDGFATVRIGDHPTIWFLLETGP
ncbi:MAG: hypothetical protein RBS80_28095 [Thermoguttaceae bacterium]|nr:hypothetical protein [Thermoguttaceae bacterium]